jgi:phage gp45-like
MTTLSEDNTIASATHCCELPSGRSVVLRLEGQQEELQVRSPSGDVEVRIVFTDAGPVVQLRGARLELQAAESIDVTCKRFAVQTTEGTTLHSEGDVNIKAAGDVDVQGKLVKLNC